MTKPIIGNRLLLVVAATVLVASSIAHADSDGHHGDKYDGRHHDEKYGAKSELNRWPKTIAIDNLDTSMFTRGDYETAEMAEHACGECHSVDYATTQPKLSCAVWAKEMIKMGNTFGAQEHWQMDSVTYTMLNSILVYLADNYGDSDGSSTCDMDAIKAVPGLSD